MKPEAQRIAIAEACPNAVEWHEGIPYWKGSWSVVGEGNEHLALFDPLNDLNAMHAAEQSLWAKDWLLRDVFIDHLARILDPINGYRKQLGSDLLDATAAQRAEAFLKTIGKWDNT